MEEQKKGERSRKEEWRRKGRREKEKKIRKKFHAEKVKWGEKPVRGLYLKCHM